MLCKTNPFSNFSYNFNKHITAVLLYHFKKDDDMLSTYFERKTTLSAFYHGPAGFYLDELTDWLSKHGFQQETIRRRIQGVVQFVDWIQVINLKLDNLTPATMIDYRQYLKRRGQLIYPSGNSTVRWLGAICFFNFLIETEQLSIISTETILPELLQDFEQWMRAHRGVKQATLINYRHHIFDILEMLGDNPKEFTTTKLRTFILEKTHCSKVEVSKNRITATRMFLRFLISTNRCESNLEYAIPTIARWRLSTLPKYLLPEEVEQVIKACESTTALDIRNKAIILLLARLGLRSGEVAGLKLGDIDWQNGTLKVMGKNRQEAKLPLPQEVGDALQHYLLSARPNVDADSIFIRAIAPKDGITRRAVNYVAAKAIHKANIVAPSYGAHVFRHSVATSLLRQGSSLQIVGELLRHSSIETTAHYAKVDTILLQHVTKPWPGEVSC
ncbi:MAG: site-specific integrase [Pseudomonadota bacterium]|nr:site-specific integrase [Pseudomonadota bacterium]